MPTPAFPWDASSERVLELDAQLHDDDPHAPYIREVAQSVHEHRAGRTDPRQAPAARTLMELIDAYASKAIYADKCASQWRPAAQAERDALRAAIAAALDAYARHHDD